MDDLTTARLVLRPYVREDLTAFLTLALDHRVTRLVGNGAAWTADRANARWWSGTTAHQQGEGLWLKVMDRLSQEHLGVVAAHRVEQDLEIGVWVTPDHRSTGLGQEALLAFLPELRRRFRAQPIVAEVDVQHTASAGVTGSHSSQPDDRLPQHPCGAGRVQGAAQQPFARDLRIGVLADRRARDVATGGSGCRCRGRLRVPGAMGCPADDPATTTCPKTNVPADAPHPSLDLG